MWLPPRFGRMAGAALLHALLAPSISRADVRVEGGEDAVSIEARDSTVREVVEALSAAYGLTYPESAELGATVHGSFQGSLLQVLRRVLEGHDYVAARSAGGEVEILWLKPRSGRAAGSAERIATDVARPIPEATPQPGQPAAAPSISALPRSPPVWRAALESRGAKQMPDRSAEAYGVGRFRRLGPHVR